MKTLVFAAVYYLLVTPAGLLARWVHDPLARTWDRKAATYWASPRA